MRIVPMLSRWFARVWDWVESLVRGRWSRARRTQARIAAEARLIGAEARQLGAPLWDAIDALAFTPERTALAPVRPQFYGHGAFMGAAPALVADRAWRRILAFLMPAVYEPVRAALARSADTACIMPMLENNPVLAAFGTLRAVTSGGPDESPNHLAGMEWDVFVDTALVAAWAASRGDPEAHAAVMARVLDTALVAHANSADTVQESLGVSQYADVRRTPKTAFGGVEMDAWIDLFGRALALATAAEVPAAFAAMAEEPRSASTEACMLHTFARPWPVAKVVALHHAVTGRERLSIVIDIKSLDSTPEFLTDLVRTLNGFGVHVAAIGSFLLGEIRGVSDTEQHIGMCHAPGPREVLFFHYAGCLQAACEAGTVPFGQSVLFNGASLLDVTGSSGGAHRYSARLRVLDELEALRVAHGLEIGFYVQEGDCEGAAAAVLSDLVSARPETFALGFAWGGLRDEASLPAGEKPRLGYGGQRLLEYVGKARKWEMKGAP